jgi:hypothetical protein
MRGFVSHFFRLMASQKRFNGVLGIVRKMIASGDLPVIRFGRALRLLQLDLDVFIGRQM